MHETLKTFDYPSSFLASTEHWVILLRPKQVTLGSMVLAVRDPKVKSIGLLSPAAAQELPQLANSIEIALRTEFGAARFNYLCLMMVDPQVHFHVIPRYSQPIAFHGQGHVDDRWPGPPDITAIIDMEPAAHARLHVVLKAAIARELPTSLRQNNV